MINSVSSKLLPTPKVPERPVLSSLENGVRLYQTSSAFPKLIEGKGLQFRGDAAGFISPNEANFRLFYPRIQSTNGVILGIGAFQNLNLLAAAPEASGLILGEIDPMPALTMALLLPVLASRSDPKVFATEAKQLVMKGEDPSRVLSLFPEEFHPSMKDHIENLRERSKPSPKRPDFTVFPGRRLINVLDRYQSDRDSFLGSSDAYLGCHAKLRATGAAVVHGNFFEEEMYSIVRNEMEHHSQSIQAIYTSNALEWMAHSPDKPSVRPLITLLHAPFVDPEGQFLMTIAFPEEDSSGIFSGAFRYYAMTIRQAWTLLERAGDFDRFVTHIKRRSDFQLSDGQ